MSNLELIINQDSWTIIIMAEKIKKYYMIDTTNKKLYIANVDIDQTKYAVWQNYHEPYKENYL